jgi:hypothetical protein
MSVTGIALLSASTYVQPLASPSIFQEILVRAKPQFLVKTVCRVQLYFLLLGRFL